MTRDIQTLVRIFKKLIMIMLPMLVLSCTEERRAGDDKATMEVPQEKREYFYLRPELEKKYGYTQAVRVGKLVKVGGVISIDDKGNPLAQNDYLQQMKNCYANLEKVLQHYGCTFKDVILENIYTTNMAELHKNGAYRHEIYKDHFPTGSWIGISELGLPEMMIEIEVEALIP